MRILGTLPRPAEAETPKGGWQQSVFAQAAEWAFGNPCSSPGSRKALEIGDLSKESQPVPATLCVGEDPL